MAEKQFAGVDVSKHALDVALVPSKTEARFENTPEGIGKLVSWLKEQGAEKAVMEATGGLEMDAALAIDQAKIAVSIVNPRQIRRFAEAMGTFEKTDRIDAVM